MNREGWTTMEMDHLTRTISWPTIDRVSIVVVVETQQAGSSDGRVVVCGVKPWSRRGQYQGSYKTAGSVEDQRFSREGMQVGT